MTGLPVTLACGPYDRMQALYNGTVRIEGVELRAEIIQEPMQIFGRMLATEAFDIAEMSLTHCFLLRASNRAKFVALPVFPSRMFRHGYIFVNAKSGIAAPRDLEGKRIGVQGYQMTAAVWIRGMLRRDYGVRFDGAHWYEGGVNQPTVFGGETTRLRPNQALDIHAIGPGATLSDMLATGEIDALIGAVTPSAFGRSPDVRRLFADHHAVERDYFKTTGIFPVMHALVIREAVHSAHPWLAQHVYVACVAAKDLALRQARFSASLCFMLPWLDEHVAEIRAVFGDDSWPYGLAANRATLDAFNAFLVDDGFLPAPLALDDVFVDIGAQPDKAAQAAGATT